MLIGSTYIPPSHFDHFHWLVTERPSHVASWFYWMERRSPHEGEYVDLSTVDELLRPIVEEAQSKGILTLPSCQGHWVDIDVMRQQVRWLAREAERMRYGLLPLIDVETGTVHLPTLPQYTAPEPTDLLRPMLYHQGVGRMGFGLEDEDMARWLSGRLSSIGGTRLEGTKVSVVVKGVAPDDLENRWLRVHRAIQQIPS